MPSFAIEKELLLQTAGVPIAEVLRRAKVDRSTWTGWKKRSIEPRLSTLKRAEAEIAKALANPEQYRKGRAA